MIFKSLISDQRNFDLVLITAPWTETDIPMLAPAALKSVVEKAGFTCLAVDLNAEIRHTVVKPSEHKQELIDFFYNGTLDPVVEDTFFDMYSSIAKQIVDLNPAYLGISLFSYVSQISTQWICYFVRKLDPDIKIVVGGAGCLPNFTGPSEYVNKLFKQKLIDYHIRGDAELSLVELLKGNTSYTGINDITWTELTSDDMANMPYPDYDNYNLDYYEEHILSLIGSRGCVRNCTFCDYIANWPKFQWRTAESIFNEMLHQSQKYDVTEFKFQDSLTNGNLKEFKKLTAMLAEYNESATNKISWSGYYIFRNSTPSLETEWEIIKKSGAKILVVGIENLNQHIRYAMGKKFDDQSIEDNLRLAKKHNVKLLLLNIVGYINETEKDIEYIESWIDSHTEYKDTIILQWGGTLGIFPNTYLDKNKTELGITMIKDHPSYWISTSTNSTHSTRAAWVKRLQERSKSLGYEVCEGIDIHYILELLMKHE